MIGLRQEAHGRERGQERRERDERTPSRAQRPNRGSMEPEGVLRGRTSPERARDRVSSLVRSARSGTDELRARERDRRRPSVGDSP